MIKRLREFFRKSSRIFANNAARLKNGLYLNAVEIQQDESESEYFLAVPVGSFPQHHNGPHIVTTDHIRQMVANFHRTKLDVLVDWEHNSLWGDSIAAGWIDDVKFSEKGLLAKYPAFTPPASEQIKNREYRYFSPVYELEAYDKGGTFIGARFDSMALTNTPYLDNEIDHIRNKKAETKRMYTKAFLQKLGLDENATDEQIEKAVTEKMGSGEPATETQTAEPTPAENPETESNDTVLAELQKINSRLDKLESGQVKTQDQQIETILNSAVSEFRILPKNRWLWEQQLKANFDATKSALDKIEPGTEKPGNVKVNSEKDGGGEKGNVLAKGTAAIRQKMAEMGTVKQ